MPRPLPRPAGTTRHTLFTRGGALGLTALRNAEPDVQPRRTRPAHGAAAQAIETAKKAA
ncbi:hypothetical protein RB200_15975 [Streptomyces sp. PmtG]